MQPRTQGYEQGQSDYRQNRCLVFLNPQGTLTWCTDAEVGVPEGEKEAWGRDYHQGWQAAAQGKTLPPPAGSDSDNYLTSWPTSSEDDRPTYVP